MRLGEVINRSVDAAPTRRWMQGVMVTFGLCGWMLSSYLGRLPQIRDDLGASTLQISVLTLGIAVGSLVGLLSSGAVVARFGARRSMAVSLPGIAVATSLAAAGASSGVFGLTLAPLVLVGLCHGMTDVAMNVSGAANERALGRPVMPLFHAAFSLGTVAGALTATVAQATHLSVCAHLVAASALTLVVGWFAVRPIPLIAPDADDHAPVSAAERRAVWRDRRVLGIGLVMLGMSLAEGSANDWLALAMVDDHGVSKPLGTVAFALFVTSMTLGRFGGGAALRRYGRVAVLRTCGLLAFVGLAVVIFGPTWAAYPAIVLWGVGASLGFPVGISAAADNPRLAAARVSVASTIGYLAFLGGPPIIGALGEYVTISGALVVVLVAVVGATLAVPAVRRQPPSGA